MGMTRFIGKGFLASGFLLGIYGLTEGHIILERSGLGLIAAGILAMGYGLYRTVMARAHQAGK